MKKIVLSNFSSSSNSFHFPKLQHIGMFLPKGSLNFKDCPGSMEEKQISTQLVVLSIFLPKSTLNFPRRINMGGFYFP